MRVTANERRRAILETLCRRRRDTRENLAFESGVSVRTIEYDVQRLSQSYPIYTEQGRAGGIYVMKGYRLDGRYLSASSAVRASQFSQCSRMRGESAVSEYRSLGQASFRSSEYCAGP